MKTNKRTSNFEMLCQYTLLYQLCCKDGGIVTTTLPPGFNDDMAGNFERFCSEHGLVPIRKEARFWVLKNGEAH